MIIKEHQKSVFTAKKFNLFSSKIHLFKNYIIMILLAKTKQNISFIEGK